MSTDTGDTGFDIDSSIDSISAGLGLGGREAPETETQQLDITGQPADAPAPRAAPKAWAKEHHERWGKLDKDTQDYIELREKQMVEGMDSYKKTATFGNEFKELLSPYSALLKSQGVTEHQAVQYLLNAHYRLTNGTPEERRNAYQLLGKDMGLVDNEPAPNADPQITALQKQIQALQSDRSTEKRNAEQAKRQQVDAEINAFSADPANEFFDEVGNDMVPLVQAGMSLKEAYERAIWSNPVTRQKMMAKAQTEQAASAQAKAKEQTEAARKAAAATPRGADTRQAPTEPKGTMEDTMRETLKKIRERAH